MGFFMMRGAPVLAFLSFCFPGNAFVPRVAPTTIRKATHLFLEDWVAEMIDNELYRQNHKQEYEREWMEKNRNHVMHHIPSFVDAEDDEIDNMLQLAKDRKLARQDPQRYCADRCVATGNCQVYEDIFDLSAEEVLAFCTDCVLSEEDDGSCVLPSAFYMYAEDDNDEKQEEEEEDLDALRP